MASILVPQEPSGRGSAQDEAEEEEDDEDELLRLVLLPVLLVLFVDSATDTDRINRIGARFRHAAHFSVWSSDLMWAWWAILTMQASQI